MGGAVHTFIFDATKFSDIEAKDWLASRGFSDQLTIDDQSDAFRAEQIPPGAFKADTLEHEETGVDGVSQIVGECPDSAAQVIQRGGFISKGDGPQSFDFVVSTGEPDAYGDIVEQRGVRLAEFKKNPVVLFSHDPEKVIGRASNLRFTKDGSLAARFTFADKSHGVLGELGASVAEMIRAGFLNAASIGFTSDVREPIRGKDGKMTGIRFIKSTLKEISVVAIPANPKALVTARSLNIPESHLRQLVEPAGKMPRRAELERRLDLRTRTMR